MSPWFVIIYALDKRDYFVEYLMPNAIAPWLWAYVRGEAYSEDEAVQMILTTMERSGGGVADDRDENGRVSPQTAHKFSSR